MLTVCSHGGRVLLSAPFKSYFIIILFFQVFALFCFQVSFFCGNTGQSAWRNQFRGMLGASHITEFLLKQAATSSGGSPAGRGPERRRRGVGQPGQCGRRRPDREERGGWRSEREVIRSRQRGSPGCAKPATHNQQ